MGGDSLISEMSSRQLLTPVQSTQFLINALMSSVATHFLPQIYNGFFHTQSKLFQIFLFFPIPVILTDIVAKSSNLDTTPRWNVGLS